MRKEWKIKIGREGGEAAVFPSLLSTGPYEIGQGRSVKKRLFYSIHFREAGYLQKGRKNQDYIRSWVCTGGGGGGGGGGGLWDLGGGGSLLQ